MVILAAACCHAAYGQSPSSAVESNYEFALFGGASFGGDFAFPTLVTENGQVTSQNAGMHYASGYQLGFRGTENLSNRWAVHLEYNFANQPLRFTNLTPAVPSLSLSHYVHHFYYDGSFRLLPPGKWFRPYLKAGVGT